MSPKRKILISIVFAIFVCLWVIFIRPNPLVSEFQSKYFWLNKFENNSKFDVVVYGDSRTYRGVSPNRVIGDEQLNGFNFGFTSAGLTVEMFEFLESKLDTSIRPIIILGITPYSLTPEGSKNKFFHQEINRKTYDKFQRLNIDKYLSIFDRISMEELLKPKQSNVIQKFNIDGWVSSYREQIDTLSGLKSYEHLFENNQVSNEAVNDLMFQVKKWTNIGIDVYGYRPPTIVSMEQLENLKSGFNEKYISEQFNENGGVWLNFSSIGYESYDGSHLNYKSALKLSTELNRQIFRSE